MKSLRVLHRWRRESRALPHTHGNAFHLLCGGPEYFSALISAIDGAHYEVLIESYIWADDAVGRAILAAAEAAARRGGFVRIIMDGVGSYSVKPEAHRLMREAGGETGIFNPVRFKFIFRHWYERNHRKLAVIDGATAFIGGFGFWDVWVDEPPPKGWWDIGARVEGPIAAQFRRVFAHDWYLCRHHHLPAVREPAPAHHTGKEVLRLLPSVMGRRHLLLDLRRHIECARERAYICTTYFIPSLLLRHALRRAARRGVDVRLLLPAPLKEAVAFMFAGRRHYHSLLAAGVRIFEYQPAFLHAKYAVVDRKWGYVGSSNLDNWSGRFNLEADLETLSEGSVDILSGRFLADLGDSREISFARWKTRPFWMRVMERVFGWIDPLL